jgi:hypothetical protein
MHLATEELLKKLLPLGCLLNRVLLFLLKKWHPLRWLLRGLLLRSVLKECQKELLPLSWLLLLS